MTDASTAPANPFLAPWTTPFGLPPFERIAPEHYRPAFDRGARAHIGRDRGDRRRCRDAELRQHDRGDGAQRPRASTASRRCSSTSPAAHTNDALQAIEREIAPRLSAPSQRDLHERRRCSGASRRCSTGATSSASTPKQARVLDRYHTHFVRAGAQLDAGGEGAPGRRSLERLATLGTQFRQNVLADEKAYTLVLDGEADLAGPAGLRPRRGGARRRGARPCGQARHHAVALLDRAVPALLGPPRPAREGLPRLDRPRRERRRHRQQGDHRRDRGAARRAGAAAGLSRPSPHFRLADTMAKTPDAALELLRRSGRRRVARAGARARRPAGAGAARRAATSRIAPWDWRYYAEKVRKRASTTSTRPRSSPTCSSSASSRPPSTPRSRLFGLDFTRDAATRRAIIPTCASGR